MTTWTTGELLSQVDAFRSLGEAECESLGRHFSVAEHDSGDVLFREGETLTRLYVVVEGGVDIVLPETHGAVDRVSTLTLASMGPGECIGEYSLIDLRPASASAVVREPSRLLCIEAAELNAYLKRKPEVGREFYFNLALMLVDRLRRNNEELDLISLA